MWREVRELRLFMMQNEGLGCRMCLIHVYKELKGRCKGEQMRQLKVCADTRVQDLAPSLGKSHYVHKGTFFIPVQVPLFRSPCTAFHLSSKSTASLSLVSPTNLLRVHLIPLSLGRILNCSGSTTDPLGTPFCYPLLLGQWCESTEQMNWNPKQKPNWRSKNHCFSKQHLLHKMLHSFWFCRFTAGSCPEE